MSAFARDPAEPTAPDLGRARTRLAFVLAGTLLWMLPWAGERTGVRHAGAAGALSIAALFGLAALLLVARSRRGLGAGEALASFGVAAVATALVAVDHPWFEAGGARSLQVAVFGALTALAALDFAVQRRRVGPTGAATGLRALCALVAALSQGLVGAPIAAGTAGCLAVLAAASLAPRTASGSRRALEGVAVLAAAAFFLSPEIRAAVAPVSLLDPTPTVWAFLHRLTGIALIVLGALGVVRA